MDEDLEEELEVLVAILEDDIKIHDDKKSCDITVVLKLDESLLVCSENVEVVVQYLPPIILRVLFPPGYPEHCPPDFTIESEWVAKNEEKLIRQSLLDVCTQNTGEVVMYNIITYIKENIRNILNMKEKLTVNNEDILATIEEYNTVMIRKEYNSSIHKCEICLTDLLGQKFEVLLPCSHAFCHSCLEQYCENHIEDGSSRSIDCPDPHCRNKVDINVVQKLVRADLFERYDMRLLTMAIRSMSNSVWCPILDCQQPAEVISKEPHIGKCPVCLFVFCMECNKASHGNSLCADHGKLRTDAEEVENTSHTVKEEEITNKDFEIFQGMVKRVGAVKTRDYLDKLIIEMFGHLDEDEKRELATKYIEASSEDKIKYYEEYGRAYLEYFLSGLRGSKRRTNYSMTRFADFMNNLKDEKREDSSDQMNRLLKQLQISVFGHGLGLQPCPVCLVPIEKNGGCHHMNCTNCGVHFCWDCMQTMQACTATRCGERG